MNIKHTFVSWCEHNTSDFILQNFGFVGFVRKMSRTSAFEFGFCASVRD